MTTPSQVPVPSGLPQDLLFNAEKIDEVVTGQLLTYTDRIGGVHYTIAGLENNYNNVVENLAPLGKVYTDLAEANSAIASGEITDGAVFFIRSTSVKSIADEYQNISGVATATGKSYPTTEFVEAVSLIVKDLESIISRQSTDEQAIATFRDKLGFGLWKALLSGGFGFKNTSWVDPSGITLTGFKMLATTDKGIFIKNGLGQVKFIADENFTVAPNAIQKMRDGSFGSSVVNLTSESLDFSNGVSFKTSEFAGLTYRNKLGQVRYITDEDWRPIGAGSGETEEERIKIRNNVNLAYAQNVKSRYNSAIQRMVANLNHIIQYGQSLSIGQEGCPALSKVAIAMYDNLMWGNSSRPASRVNPAYVTLGAAALNPLKAVVQSLDGSSILTDSEVAALTPGAGNEGESGVAMVNALRKYWLQHFSLMRDESRKFVFSNTGVNGRSIEALSKGASPELFNRAVQAAQQVKAEADRLGVSYCVSAFNCLQGEWNYQARDGSTDDQALYKALLATLYADLVTSVALNVSGQTSPPAIFMYQTSAQYTRDNKNLSIGMAQHEFCKENSNAYCYGPSYPYTDKKGHLDPNGYRWQDEMAAKVMHRVLVRGEGWEHLNCIDAWYTNNKAFYSYSVMSPPLKFGTPFAVTTAMDYADKGYRSYDDAGPLVITAVDIVADTIIRVTYNRNVVGVLRTFYADKTAHEGNGCIMDSDDFVSATVYEYNTGTGQYPSANIPALVGKPYPLNNWAVAQFITVEAQ